MSNEEIQRHNERAAYDALVSLMPQATINQAYTMVKGMGIPWTMKFFRGKLPEEIADIVEMAFKEMERLQQWDA